MSQKPLTISLVIPVYNEESHLAHCLEAASAQKHPFHEIIVVDNNSTDDTAKIAADFPNVTLINERRQGVVFARARGFDAVRGDIIARIDADTVLSADWTKQVQRIFTDTSVGAVSGSITYHDIPFPDFFAKVELFFRNHIARAMGDEVFLYGANMALRTSTWRRVRRTLCKSGGMHEDFDLAIHAEEAGERVVFDERLHAAVSLRRFDTTFIDFWHYVLLNPKTYALHGRTSQRHMYPVIALVLLFYGAIRLLFRAYDPVRRKFSLHKLLLTTSGRVNPATFVD